MNGSMQPSSPFLTLSTTIPCFLAAPASSSSKLGTVSPAALILVLVLFMEAKPGVPYVLHIEALGGSPIILARPKSTVERLDRIPIEFMRIILEQ